MLAKVGLFVSQMPAMIGLGFWVLLAMLHACPVAATGGDGDGDGSAAPQEQRRDSDDLLFALALGFSTSLLVLSGAAALWHRCRGTHDDHHHGPGSKPGEAPAHAAWTTWHGKPACDPGLPSHTRAGCGVLPGLAAGEGRALPGATVAAAPGAAGTGGRVLV